MFICVIETIFMATSIMFRPNKPWILSVHKKIWNSSSLNSDSLSRWARGRDPGNVYQRGKKSDIPAAIWKVLTIVRNLHHKISDKKNSEANVRAIHFITWCETRVKIGIHGTARSSVFEKEHRLWVVCVRVWAWYAFMVWNVPASDQTTSQ